MIRHVSRGTSTFWRRVPGTLLPPAIEVLGAYEMWDGANLFSSAFKLAAVAGARSLGRLAHRGWRCTTKPPGSESDGRA
jgi:hypothetical protein